MKLFAHLEREDQHAREALADHTATFPARDAADHADEPDGLGPQQRADRRATGALAIWLWMRGAVTLGDIAVASGLAHPHRHHVGLGDVDVDRHLRQHRHRAGGHAHDRAAADARRRAGARRRSIAPRGAIRFENVRFHYGKGGGVIDDLSFTIAPGEKVGLVGRSGAGKSTLVNLLLRFYDVEGGRILIDGQDIAAVEPGSLRQQIGMVTQDTSLLHRSIADNILYGRPDAPMEAVVAAARQAHADAFVADARRSRRAQRLRRPGRRARRQAVRRPAPTHRDRARDAEERADPGARRGDLGARFGGRGGDPGEPLSR